MRLSRSLRRYRWLVFTGWLLALVPAIYLAMTQSGNLTGGGFEVAGSQSLAVHDQLEDLYHDQGASSLALVAAPRPDASYQDINDAVALLRQIAGEFPGLTEAPNPAQRPPQPDRPYVVSLRLDARNAGTSDVAKQLRQKVGVKGDQSGQTANGRVRLYVIGQGALSAAAAANTKRDIAAAERWNLPIILIVLLAVFGSLAAAAIPLALGICTVVVTMGLVYLLSEYTTMSVFVTSTVSMFGIALAVDYSLFISIPLAFLVTGAVGVFDGTLTTLRAHERGSDGTRNPTFRCLFPEPPPPGAVPACAEAGILGALTGVLGSLMALEVIREIVGFGEGLVGRLLMLDARSLRFETLAYAWDPSNPLSGEHPTIRDLSGHA